MERTEITIAGALSQPKCRKWSCTENGRVIVPDNQLWPLKGRSKRPPGGKITGWKIDICSESQIAQERLSSLGLIDSPSPGNEPAAKESTENNTLESETAPNEAESENVEQETADLLREQAPEEASTGDGQSA